MNKIFVIGNIGCGKSLFSSVLSTQLKASGYKSIILDLDDVGHNVLSSDAVFKLACREFGDFESREELASIVFESQDKINKLDSIVRPCIFDKMQSILKENLTKGYDFTIVEESAYNGPQDEFTACADYIIALIADFTTRLNRCLDRGMTEIDFRKRNDLQIEQDVLIKNADFIVDNNNELDDFENIIDDLIKKF